MSHKLLEEVFGRVGFRVNHILSSILVLVFALHSLFSQATIPQLNLSNYDENMMSEVYGQSYFMNSLSAWTEQVEYYQGLIRASWEAAADQAIYDYVDTITMSDAYNTVAAYKDYVTRELFSQKEEALVTWEDRANLDLLSNRNEFVARLNTNRVNEVYLDRLYQGFQVANLANQAPITLQNQIEDARSNWENTYEQSYMQGNYDFANAFSQINQSYTDVLASLDTTEQAFQANLRAIDKYKKEVKGAIAGMLTGFEIDLAKSCNPTLGCAYRKADQSYNEAGELLSNLITKIRARLDAPVVEATFALTDLAVEMNTFLKTQRDVAQGNFDRDNNLVYTYQTTLNGASNHMQLGNTNFDDLRREVERGGFDLWANRSKNFEWRYSNHTDPTKYFDNVENEGKAREILDAIERNQRASLISLINNSLSPGRRVDESSEIASNIYTKDSDQWKNHWDRIWAFTGVEKNGSCAVWPPSDCNANHFASVKQGNKILDDLAGKNYRAYKIHRMTVVNDYQMDSVTYALAYKVFDQNKQDQANYWSGIRSSMNGQINQYEMNITPAIRAWETQVKNYDKFYTDWKIKADITRAQALVDRDNAQSQLEENKQRWIGKIQDEFIAGRNQWDGMERQVTLTSSNAEAKALDLQVQSKLASLGQTDFSTGTSAVVANFNQSLDKLMSTTVNNISLFGAETKMSVATSLEIGDKNFTDILKTTVNGVYQYAQLLSVNENNNNTAIAEQKKLINQMAYGIKWEDRAVAKFDESGNLVVKAGASLAEGTLKAILKDLQNNKKYETAIANCSAENAANKTTRDCFAESRAGSLATLKGRGYEYQDGMIVESLDKASKIKLNLLSSSEFNDLTEQEKEEAGSCYANPESAACRSLLRKDFTYTFDEKTKIVNLSRQISNGRVVGRNSEGKYIDEKRSESRSVMLSSVKPVTAPKGKDLFDVWQNADWKDFDTQAKAVMSDFYSNGISKDRTGISRQVADIRSVESANEKKFQKEKQDLEARDSLIKDLVIAYISGGMAGVKGAIKNKVEDQINTGLAEAWARATGADDDQIAALTQAVSFMRGKMAEKKIKSNMAQNNIANAGMAVVAGGMMFATGGMAGVLLANSPIAAMNSFASGVGNMAGAALSAMNPMTLAFGQAGMGLVTGATAGVYRAVAGDKAADAMLNRMTGPKDKLAAIRANEQAIVQSNVTQAVAKITGLPPEVAGNIVTDYKGAKAAKKVRNAVNANPIANISSQVAGAVGGIVKSALVATGIKERDIQRAMSDGNRMMFAGSRDANLEAQTLAYTNQSLGMKAPGTSYTSATPTLKDKKGFVKELGQRAVVDAMSVGMSKEEKEVINAAFRKGYGAMEQRRADKKAQTEAVRSTVVTAVTTLATLGAGAIANAVSAAGQALTATGNAIANAVGVGLQMISYTPQIMATVIQTTVQVIDGSRNGTDGMVAGLANGVLGGLTAGGALDFGDVTGPLKNVLSNSTLGLGVTYDKQNGYGGMIGLGGAKGNVSLSFSQNGNTSINASVDTNRAGLQLTGSMTTNGEQTVGMNYNASNRGPRQGWNVAANYDLNGGGMSGSVGYTDPGSALGLTSTVDRKGLSTSSQYNGNNIGTMTADGYTADEFNWAQNNINNAQNRTDELRQRAAVAADGGNQDLVRRMENGEELSPTDQARIERAEQNQLLRDSGMSNEQIANLSPDARVEQLRAVSPQDVEGIANSAALLLGSSAVALGFMGFAGSANGNGTGQTPTNTRADGPVVGRRREGEEDADNTRNNEAVDDSVERPLDFEDQIKKLPEALRDQVVSWKGDENGNKKLVLADGKEISVAADGSVTVWTNDHKPNIVLAQYTKNQTIELTGKSLSEIKTHLQSLTTNQLNQLAKEGKKSNLADFKKSDIVITKTDVLDYRDQIVDPAQESTVRTINEKINSILEGKLLTDVSVAGTIRDLTSDVSAATYNNAIIGSQAQRMMANGFGDVANSFPLLNKVREGMIQNSESTAVSATNRFINTVMPTADQLKVAEKNLKDFQEGKIPKLDAKTASIVAKNLILDPEFAKQAQPQKLKDSYERLTKANDGYKALVDKITNGELNQVEVKLELAKLDAAHKKALAEHESNWKSYESDVAKMIQDRGTDGNVGISQLAKVSTGLVVDGPIQQKKVTANFRVYHDRSGNPILVASGDAIRLERASQQKDFQNAIMEASKRPDGIPPEIKIDPVSGVIQTGLDGKKLTMSIEDTQRRKDAYKAIRDSLGNDFRPDLNPNFAKLEAIGNFEQKLSAEGKPLFDNNKPVYTTSVNGVNFDFIGDHSVPPERSMVVADGANWMKLSQAAKESGIESLGLTSVKRDDSSSHGAGYSFDVGSVTDANGKETFIKYNKDFQKGQIIEPKPPLDKFLDKISSESSNKISYNPYYMVDGNGNKTPNFFTAVGEKNWELKNDWDGAKTGLSVEQRTEFSKLMSEMASKHEPPFILTAVDIKQMWNHRHHLHITEISK
jgi:hypothetical protein